MRVSGKRQGIDKWSNDWLCSTEFLRIKGKYKKKLRELKKDNSLTHFNFSVLFVLYNREEVEIRHEESLYNKEKIPSLTSTQIFSLVRSTSIKLVEHLWQARWTNTTFGFQEMKKGMLMLKMVNMTQEINRKMPPSSMNKKEGYASVQPILKVRMGR